MEPEGSCRDHEIPQPIHMRTQMDSVRTLQPYSSNIYFSIVFTSTSRHSGWWALPLGFPASFYSDGLRKVMTNKATLNYINVV